MDNYLQRTYMNDCRRIRKWILLFSAILLSFIGMALRDNTVYAGTGEQAEWTVLIYLCGSDLESKYGYATDNLKDISDCRYPDSYFENLIENGTLTLNPSEKAEEKAVPLEGKVNILFETGGCSKWHTTEIGLDISTKKLQRWRYSYFPDGHFGENPKDGFSLVEELPLQSMASPETLTDFIRWGAEQYPAKKTALVLWDHGMGSKSGLFIDELFDRDIMYLYELRDALKNSGVHLENIIFDACLMANIETAWNVRDCAEWMTASEEVVPGGGSAIGDWLQELISHPGCDGKQLGRWICDMTQIMYDNENDRQARTLLKWFVIKLSEIDRVVKAWQNFFKELDKIYVQYPPLMSAYVDYMYKAEEYGDGQQSMIDIASIFYNEYTVHTMDISMRNEMLDSLSEAISYCAHGNGRSSARGLSFCYAAGLTAAELDIYAKNCPNPYYLAFLDAITDWTAPNQVYKETERLPEINTLEDFRITVEKKKSKSGIPGIEIVSGDIGVGTILFRMYHKDEQTGEVVRIGRTTCSISETEDDKLLWVPRSLTKWPSIEGTLCDMEYLQEVEPGCLFDIPVQIGREIGSLRCGRHILQNDESEFYLEDSPAEYEVFGLFEGYEEDTEAPNRSVKDLSKLAGRDYQLLYPVDGSEKGNYSASESLTMYRQLDVEEITLPPGTYYLEYEVDDIFMYPYVLDRIKLTWDGKSFKFQKKLSWKGTVTLERGK